MKEQKLLSKLMTSNGMKVLKNISAAQIIQNCLICPPSTVRVAMEKIAHAENKIVVITMDIGPIIGLLYFT